MSLIIGCFTLLAGFVILAVSADEWQARYMLGITGATVALGGLLLFGVMYVNARFYPRIEVSRIEAVRSAVKECPRDRSHALYLEAVQTNETIREAQAWRRLWWARDFTNAGWDSIQVIAFPADSVGGE